MQNEKRWHPSPCQEEGGHDTKAKGKKLRATGSNEKSKSMEREEDLAICEKVKGFAARLPSGVFP